MMCQADNETVETHYHVILMLYYELMYYLAGATDSLHVLYVAFNRDLVNVKRMT